MAKLVWNATGDEIPLVACDAELFDYYVNQLQHHNLNQYRYRQFDFQKEIVELQDCLQAVAAILASKLKLSVDHWNNIDPIEQQHLNQIHTEWVKLHIKYPTFGQLCEKSHPGTIQKINRINKLIHWFEESFNEIGLIGPDSNANFANPFGTKILSFSSSNILISYNNLGRSTFNKWLNFDNTLGEDTNDYVSMYTTLTVRVGRSITPGPPTEYIDWCVKNNITPVGARLPLANFDKLEENLLLYRQLFYRNQTQDDNYIIFKE